MKKEKTPSLTGKVAIHEGTSRNRMTVACDLREGVTHESP